MCNIFLIKLKDKVFGYGTAGQIAGRKRTKSGKIITLHYKKYNIKSHFMKGLIIFPTLLRQNVCFPDNTNLFFLAKSLTYF